MLKINTTLEGYSYKPLLKSETIKVTGLKRTSFDLCSLGIVPEGDEGRQVFQGPMVPGPWGFAVTHPLVIDSCGRAARERAQALEIEVGTPFEVEGLPGVWTFGSPRRSYLDGDGPRLIPADEFVD